MLYREIIAVCSQIHTKHINTECGQNVEFLGPITKLRTAIIGFVRTVRPARMKPLGCHWTNFREISELRIFLKSAEKIQVSLKSEKDNGTALHMQTVTCRPSHVDRHMQTVTCRPSHVDRHMQTVTCRPSHADRHMQTVTCRPSHIYGHIWRGSAYSEKCCRRKLQGRSIHTVSVP